MKKSLLFLLALPIACLTPSCYTKVVVETKVKSVSNPVFGNIDFELTQQEFLSKGINYDDLLKFTIDNPIEEEEDIVFEAAFVKNYNEVGYFAPCLCNYGGTAERPELSFGIMPEKNDPSSLIGQDVKIEMLHKGGYARTRKLVDVAKKLTYEEVGKDNLAYANFRDITTVGTINKYMHDKCVFRGSSPFNAKDNPDDRDFIADAYLGFFDIQSEVSLANNKEEIARMMHEVETKRPHSNTLTYYKESETSEVISDKKFFAVDLGSDYYDMTHEDKDGMNARKVFEYIASRCQGGGNLHLPVYIHCNEGKDRTGFIVMVLEALGGVPLSEIVSDAMLTFKNYYNVSIVNNKEKYDTLANLLIYRHIYSILLTDPCAALPSINWYEFDAKKAVEEIIAEHPNALQEGAEYYLSSILELENKEIETLISWLSKSN